MLLNFYQIIKIKYGITFSDDPDSFMKKAHIYFKYSIAELREILNELQ